MLRCLVCRELIRSEDDFTWDSEISALVHIDCFEADG